MPPFKAKLQPFAKVGIVLIALVSIVPGLLGGAYSFVGLLWILPIWAHNNQQERLKECRRLIMMGREFMEEARQSVEDLQALSLRQQETIARLRQENAQKQRWIDNAQNAVGAAQTFLRGSK